MGYCHKKNSFIRYISILIEKYKYTYSIRTIHNIKVAYINNLKSIILDKTTNIIGNNVFMKNSNSTFFVFFYYFFSKCFPNEYYL